MLTHHIIVTKAVIDHFFTVCYRDVISKCAVVVVEREDSADSLGQIIFDKYLHRTIEAFTMVLCCCFCCCSAL